MYFRRNLYTESYSSKIAPKKFEVAELRLTKLFIQKSLFTVLILFFFMEYYFMLSMKMNPVIILKNFDLRSFIITGVMTFLVGLAGIFGFNIIGWILITKAERLPSYNSTDNVMYACQAIGKYFPPLGFPFKYFVSTNMSELFPTHYLHVSIWQVGACGTSSFVNPIAFIGNFFIFFLILILYRLHKRK